MLPPSPILAPVVALVAWTLVMWLWLYIARIPAMQKAKIDATTLVGSTGRSLDDALPASVQWKAHNYNHLMEQPTLFYAIAFVLALTGTGDGLNAIIAWSYVGLRIAHSIVQATINRVIIRFALFMLASLALIMLTVHAAITVFALH